MYFCERQAGESVFFLCGTTQQLINSTTQQLNNSTTHQFNNSTTHQFNNSTTQQLNNSTTQQLNNTISPKILFFAYNLRSLQGILPKCLYLDE